MGMEITFGKTAIHITTVHSENMDRMSVLLAGGIKCQEVELGLTSIMANHTDRDPDRLASFKSIESQSANVQPPKYDYTALKYTDW